MKETTDRNRFFKMADCYDAMCRRLVPAYDFLQQETLRMCPYGPDEKIRILDLGGGSGIMLERLLDRFPFAEAIWLDYSDDFLRVAKMRLHRFGDRVGFVQSRMEAPWKDNFLGSYHLIVSMSAIHHLLPKEKADLYGRCHDALNPGGWFFNIDEMKTFYSDAYEESLRFWVQHVKTQKDNVPVRDVPLYNQWNEKFQRWKKRNIDRPNEPKIKGDDLHDDYQTQLSWLVSAGFIKVDLFIKYHLWCVIGGQRRPAVL